VSSPRVKGPTPYVPKDITGPFRRTIDVPVTSTQPDPYAPNTNGVSKRQGQDVNTRKTRAQFRQIEFQRAILQHGYFLSWTKAIICPCMNPETQQTLVNCTTCDGSGFYYLDALEVRGIMSNLERNQRVFEKFGAWAEGTSQLTVEPQYRMGYRDRVELLDAVMVHNELFQKGDRRGTRSKLPARSDSLRYRVARMTKLVVNGTGIDPACCTPKMLANNATPDDHTLYALEEGYHFNITKDGWVEWTPQGDDFVLDEAWVSALYEYRPVYLVVSHPHATRQETLESKSPVIQPFALPVQSLVKLDFLADISSPLPSMTTIT